MGSTPSIWWESIIWPVGESTKIAMDPFPGCAFCHSTQASTMAVAVSALMTAFINVRFADPNVFSDQDVHHDYLQTSYPPFTYAVTTDPISGITDGVLKRPATDPFVFQIDDSSEIWQLRGSLNVVDGLGNPVPLPNNVRLYYNSGMAHGFITGGLRAPAPGHSTRCQNPTPSLAITETTRATLVAMDQWADQGIEPI